MSNFEEDDKVFDDFNEYCNEVVEANEAWKKRWPNHCKGCEGAGGHAIPQTYWDPPDYDICSCIEEAKCPRCGFCNWDEENVEETPCLKCGWNWGKGDDDAAPQI